MASIFYFLFHRQTISQHKLALLNSANNIATGINDLNTVPSYHYCHADMPCQTSGHFTHNHNDFWIINRQHQFIFSSSPNHHNLTYQQLPPDSMRIINQALSGQEAVSETFSSALGRPVLTATVPIRNASGCVIGVLLLHTSLKSIQSDVFYGIKLLLFSSLLGLVIATVAAWLMSYYFTIPLEKIKKLALSISKGNYKTRTEIYRSDEFGTLARYLDNMASQLAESDAKSKREEQSRRIFSANISHELRTPVAVLRASLEALHNGLVPPEEIDDYHQQMLQETIYLERLVNDMLELSKLQNPDFIIEKKPLLLNDLVIDAVRSLRSYASQKAIKLEISSQLPPTEINGDYGRLRQMLIIILDNAIKFSHPHDTIKLRLAAQANKIILQIIDTGCGIAADLLPHIFERFHKTDMPANKKGTGLGLTIAKQIAQRHSMNIDVQSTLGKGTTFTINIKKP